jgi:thiol:disulfide interchange protein
MAHSYAMNPVGLTTLKARIVADNTGNCLAVVRLLNSKEVVPVKVDLTGNNTAGNEKLIEVGRLTIPYLVVYSRSGQQIFASDAYTVEQVTQALRQATQLR